MAYWLFKTEPDVFSIDNLKAKDEAGEIWDGVRNYQARNFMRDNAKIGDKLFIYHSSCKQIGIAGIATIIETNIADPSQFEQDSEYYDAKSTQENPRWICVKIKFERKFNKIIPLDKLKSIADLADMPLVKKGNRLSIMPLTEKHWLSILALAT